MLSMDNLFLLRPAFVPCLHQAEKCIDRNELSLLDDKQMKWPVLLSTND